MIHMTRSTPEDIMLHTVMNPWKPRRLYSDPKKPKRIKETEDLYKAVRGILNKLTPQRFVILMKKFKDLKIDSEEKLKGVVNQIFEKALDEPNYVKCYSHMCRICSKIEVSKMKENGVEEKFNFRKLLINRCQAEFESSKPAELDIAKHKEEIRNCTNPEQKKELQLAYQEKERAFRMKSIGNIRFIGELFKLNMLIPAIMYRCIEHLLSNPEEESLECLCKLLTTIGKELEFGGGANNKIQVLNSYFQKMLDLTQKKDDSYKVSPRVRIMLKDVIELRQSKWMPRRNDNNSKTFDQIVHRAQIKSLERSIELNQQPPRINNQPSDRQDDRGKRSNRGGNNNNVGKDGWVNVGSKHYHNKQFTTPFEASKMMNVKPELDLNNFSLGSDSKFRQFGMNRAMENKPGPASVFTSSTAYFALSRGDERKPPQPSMNSNRRIITPTPSIQRDKERERERQRMIQGVESDGRSSRGSSAQWGPPSRDSSVPPPATKPADDPIVARTAPVDQEKLKRKTNIILEDYLTGHLTLED